MNSVNSGLQHETPDPADSPPCAGATATAPARPSTQPSAFADEQPPLPEHVDVLIVGAGLSGIGAACHLQRQCPGRSFAILESRGAIGGTWDLFRYPGIRSDSDMYTLGYSFKPWPGAKSIADGDSILEYVRETAREHDIDRTIHFGHRVERAEFSSETGRWTVYARREADGETVSIVCDFLYGCTGYYRYDEGYSPQLPGAERFAGEIVHPQHWPSELEWAGKRVVVVGSGATAVTLVPALAERAAHVTMLQRSPSYVLSLPSRDPVADALRRRLPARHAYALVRWKNVLLTMANYQLCRRAPNLMRRLLRRLAASQLPDGYDVDTHFNPSYAPWDQRLCLVPDGDLFSALAQGRASVATGEVETFEADGIRLRSGEKLEAEIVISATGLNLLVLGGIEIAVDRRAVDPGGTVAYKGMMLCGVPNLAFTVGYTNASWTLKADLVAEYVCRLLRHMDARGARICTPVAPDGPQTTAPLIDLKSGYVLRSIDRLPRQGATAPWRLHQNYIRDVRLLKRGPLDDALELSNPHVATGAHLTPAPEPLAQAEVAA